MSDIWVLKPSVLFTEKKLKEFIPKPTMTYSEKLNALTRLIIYMSLLFFIIHRNFMILLLPLSCMAVIFFLVKWGIELDKIKEYFQNTPVETHREPTYSNPFMNQLPTDKVIQPKTCADNEETRSKINEAFNFNLYKNTDDIYGRENSQRQFYTAPSNIHPNSQKHFAQWLYSDIGGRKNDLR